MDLEYEKLMESHADKLVDIWSDQEVIKYTNVKHPCTPEEIHDRITRFKNFDVFVIYHSNDLVGIIGCPCIDASKSQYGLFYQFKKSVWGQGYATVAVEWILNYMKDKYKNVHLYADVVVDNIASDKILRHFGFRYLDENGDCFERDGVRMNVRNYRLDWELS